MNIAKLTIGTVLITPLLAVLFVIYIFYTYIEPQVVFVNKTADEIHLEISQGNALRREIVKPKMKFFFRPNGDYSFDLRAYRSSFSHTNIGAPDQQSVSIEKIVSVAGLKIVLASNATGRLEIRKGS